MMKQTRHPRFSGDFRPTEHFQIPDLKEWEKLAVSSLKGRSLEKLEALLPEAFRTRILYSAENSSSDPGTPGSAPYLRGSSLDPRPWLSCPLIDSADPEAAGQAASFAVGRDAGALWLHIADSSAPGNRDGGINLRAPEDFRKVLGDVDLSAVEIYLDGGSDGIRPALALIDYCQKSGLSLENLRGSCGLDPLGALASHGSLPGGSEAQFNTVAAMMAWSSTHCPLMKSLCLSSLPYNEAGASAVEELGLLLASSVEYLRRLEASGISPDEGAGTLLFRIAIGRDFFTAIAKFRALRGLWASAASHCGLADSTPPPIHAVTSARSLSRRDPWVNLLRQTVESFAAIAGGAEIITTRSFDSLQSEPGELGRRMALNTQTILREECHLGRIVDPGGGSWYIEELSRQLAEGAWEYFRKIEAKGGIFRCLKEGIIQQNLEKKRAQLELQIAQRKMPITGVSTWARIEEKIPPQRNTETPPKPGQMEFLLSSIRDAEGIDAALRSLDAKLEKLGWPESEEDPFIPLSTMREAEGFEALQDRAARLTQLGRNTEILLLKLGPNSETTDREGFIVNFFAAGGIRSPSEGGFETVEECIKALRATDGTRICLIGADARYPDILPELLPALREAGVNRIFLAGRAGEHEKEWRSAGVDAFIHLGIDVLAFLTELLDDMEVEA